MRIIKNLVGALLVFVVLLYTLTLFIMLGGGLGEYLSGSDLGNWPIELFIPGFAASYLAVYHSFYFTLSVGAFIIFCIGFLIFGRNREQIVRFNMLLYMGIILFILMPVIYWFYIKHAEESDGVYLLSFIIVNIAFAILCAIGLGTIWRRFFKG